MISPFGMGLRTWDPWGESRRWRHGINSLLSPRYSRITENFPPINIWVKEDSVMVMAELPGCDPEKLDISVNQETLTIEGLREARAEGEEIVHHKAERQRGPFSRAVKLPFRIDAERVEASYDKGILRLVLPRPAEDAPRKINVKAAA